MTRTLSLFFLAFLLFTISCSKKKVGRIASHALYGSWNQTQYWLHSTDNEPSSLFPVLSTGMYVSFKDQNQFSSNIEGYNAFNEYSIKNANTVYLSVSGTFMMPVEVKYILIGGDLRLMRKSCNGCGEMFSPVK